LHRPQTIEDIMKPAIPFVLAAMVTTLTPVRADDPLDPMWGKARVPLGVEKRWGYGLSGLLVLLGWSIGHCAEDRYTVAWDSPSADYNGSMPIGNGELAANVWVEPTGDLVVKTLLPIADDVGRETFDRREPKSTGGWQQDPIQAAMPWRRTASPQESSCGENRMAGGWR
jgi:hypothetical protein